MNKKLLILFSGMICLYGCTQRTPEQLATEVCDCNKQAKSFQNTTKQLQKMDECYLLMQANLQRLQQMGVDGDWTPERVEKETQKFDKIYKTCTNGNTAE